MSLASGTARQQGLVERMLHSGGRWFVVYLAIGVLLGWLFTRLPVLGLFFVPVFFVIVRRRSKPKPAPALQVETRQL